MPVYYFIFGWTVIWGIIGNITAKPVVLDDGKYRFKVNLFVAIVAFSAVIVFAALRSEVADTAAYIKMFEEYPVGFSGIDTLLADSDSPGFVLFSVFIKTYISTDYTVWFSIIALISGVCMMIGFYQYSSNFALSAFLFIASCNFTWMFNGIRQYLVVSILFACTSLILKKKWIQYFVLVLILSTIHQSAIVMIPIYFIVNGEPWNKRTILVILGVFVCIVFADKVLNVFDSVMQETNYAVGYNEFKKTDDGVNVFTILIALVPVGLAFLFRKDLEQKYTPIMKLSTNMSIMAVCVYIVSRLTNSGILVGRMAIYFTTYNLILLPWLVDNIFKDNERRLIKYIMIVCYLYLFYYQMEKTWGGLEYISKILNLRYR